MEKTTVRELKKVLALAIKDIDKIKQDFYEFAANVADRYYPPDDEYSMRVKEQRDKRDQAVIMLGKIMENDDLLERIAATLSGDYIQERII